MCIVLYMALAVVHNLHRFGHGKVTYFLSYERAEVSMASSTCAQFPLKHAHHACLRCYCRNETAPRNKQKKHTKQSPCLPALEVCSRISLKLASHCGELSWVENANIVVFFPNQKYSTFRAVSFIVSFSNTDVICFQRNF